jgi:hypothetical protein
MSSPSSNDKLLTPEEAVDFLNLHDRPNPIGALDWICRTKGLTYITLGKGIRRFKLADLLCFVDGRREESGNDFAPQHESR